MERGHELRLMDSSSPERNSLEASDHLHREKGEGREGQETNREDLKPNNGRRQHEEKEGNGCGRHGRVRGGTQSRYRRAELRRTRSKWTRNDQMEMFSQMCQREHGEDCQARESRIEESRTST